jgi:hypothetical protein
MLSSVPDAGMVGRKDSLLRRRGKAEQPAWDDWKARSLEMR